MRVHPPLSKLRILISRLRQPIFENDCRHTAKGPDQRDTTEGFLGPLFFVWLGASLQLQALRTHPEVIALGLTFGFLALAVHAIGQLFDQDIRLGLLPASQPLGQQEHDGCDADREAAVQNPTITDYAAANSRFFPARGVS